MEINANELKALADKQEELAAATIEFRSTATALKDRMFELEQRRSAMNDLPSSNSGYIGRVASTIIKSNEAKSVAAGKSSKHGFDFNAKDILTKSAIITDLGNGDTLSQPQRIGIVGGVTLSRRLREAMPIGIATSGTVEWVKQTSAKQLAKPQFGGSPGQREAVPKSESLFTFELAKTDVVTLAHWAQGSRQVFDDEALLQSFIAGELFDGLERELEREILQGDGTSGEFEGFAKSGNSTALTGMQTGDTSADLIRRAIAQLQTSSFVPDAIILNPIDYANIELIKTSTGGDYVIGAPRGLNPPSLWNVPVYVSEYQPVGTFYVASLAQSTRLWIRQDARLLVSDSHADTFTSNLLTWLAELRACVTVNRPAGIISGAF
jgi:HK97 family phage major capsid protein